MVDRPMIFSGVMVRALLREIETPGTGKTMTRRLAWRQRHHTVTETLPTTWRKTNPGDRLWVRETWENGIGAPDEVTYRATVGDDTAWTSDEIAAIKWRPSIHMPRWASRLTLLVDAVRVERLQDITEADARAEGADLGFEAIDVPPPADGGSPEIAARWALQCINPPLIRSYRAGFRALWNHLHGPGAWEANPWVVPITFRPVRGNIDCLQETPSHG